MFVFRIKVHVIWNYYVIEWVWWVFISISQITFLEFKNLSFFPSSTTPFRYQPTDVAGHPVILVQRWDFYLLCCCCQPKGLLKYSPWSHNSRSMIWSLLQAWKCSKREAALCPLGRMGDGTLFLPLTIRMTPENVFTLCKPKFTCYKMWKNWYLSPQLLCGGNKKP